jgi:tRNA pseudouridine55 synthase
MSKKIGPRLVDGWVALINLSDSRPGRCRALRIYNAQKGRPCGHLDPLASGILPVAFGKRQRPCLSFRTARGYRFTVLWGVETDTTI